MFAWVLDTLSTRQSQDRVDIQSLICQDTSSSFYLKGLQLATQYHEDIAVLSLVSHPVFILIVSDG